MNKLIEQVEQWAEDKGILKKGNPLAQNLKGIEERHELHEALCAKVNNLDYFINSKGIHKNTDEEIVDAIGDCLVTLIVLCKLLNISLLKCLKSAYDVISKRTGRMVNGTFVKDED